MSQVVRLVQQKVADQFLKDATQLTETNPAILVPEIIELPAAVPEVSPIVPDSIKRSMITLSRRKRTSVMLACGEANSFANTISVLSEIVQESTSDEKTKPASNIVSKLQNNPGDGKKAVRVEGLTRTEVSSLCLSVSSSLSLSLSLSLSVSFSLSLSLFEG